MNEWQCLQLPWKVLSPTYPPLPIALLPHNHQPHKESSVGRIMHVIDTKHSRVYEYNESLSWHASSSLQCYQCANPTKWELPGSTLGSGTHASDACNREGDVGGEGLSIVFSTLGQGGPSDVWITWLFQSKDHNSHWFFAACMTGKNVDILTRSFIINHSKYKNLHVLCALYNGNYERRPTVGDQKFPKDKNLQAKERIGARHHHDFSTRLSSSAK